MNEELCKVCLFQWHRDYNIFGVRYPTEYEQPLNLETSHIQPFQIANTKDCGIVLELIALVSVICCGQK
ncbi:hypothetical protein HOLleu_43196 [Holothuria leucospilota]|uniref:Uncharacterized protein n=1 Tax=Holothuria leucospilota TaxID=206669 RepID=A0A9Q0YBZ8_HOLLE|nr:hypothetical protein HOLleu_43196 [Holothuria leucospilota]